MPRPSLPAAIAPFRGCPAGCLRVACETLLSPSAQKGRMNNGPRQALALNNSSLRLTLCITYSVSKSNHKLFPQIPTFFHSIQNRPSAIFFNINCFLSSASFNFSFLSYLRNLCSIAPLPQLFSSSFLVKPRQTVSIKAKGYMKHPAFSRFSGPHLTLPLPQSSKLG